MENYQNLIKSRETQRRAVLASKMQAIPKILAMDEENIGDGPSRTQNTSTFLGGMVPINTQDKIQFVP